MKEKSVKIGAIIVGLICLFVFNFIGEMVEFWMTGLILPQQIDLHAEPNSILEKNFEFFIIISLCGALIKYIPSGFIAAFVAKKRILQHGLIIATIAAIYLLISNTILEDVHIGLNLLSFFILLNTFLAFSLCLLGSLFFKCKMGGRTGSNLDL